MNKKRRFHHESDEVALVVAINRYKYYRAEAEDTQDHRIAEESLECKEEAIQEIWEIVQHTTEVPKCKS